MYFDRTGSLMAKEEEKTPMKTYGDMILASNKLKTDMLTGTIYRYNKSRNYFESEFVTNQLEKQITEMLEDDYSPFKVKGIMDYIRIMTGEDLRKYNHQNLICLNNGIIDLDRMKFVQPDDTMFVSFRIETDFNKEADLALLNTYIDSLITQEDKPKLQECFGNVFANHYTTKKVFYFYGKPDSGKSTLLKIYQDFLGSNNYSTLSLMDIAENKYALANLYRKHANFSSETDYKTDYSNVTAIKKLTGNDEFTARMIYKEPFSFTNNAKVILAGNGIPSVSKVHEDDAFYERWEFIYFPNTFDKNDDIIPTCTTKEMKEAILLWSIRGYQRLKQNKWQFSNAYTKQQVIELFETSKTSTDTFYKWLQEECVYTIDGSETVAKLFRNCRDWHLCRDLHTYPSNEQHFGIAMKNQKIFPIKDYFPVIDGKQQHHYRGIKLKEIEEGDFAV